MDEEVITITSTSHGIKEEGGSLLQKMLTSSDCFDVTLVSGDGQQVFAHKAVLSTCRFDLKNTLFKIRRFWNDRWWQNKNKNCFFASPLLASVIGRAGPACGRGGQVIYLHAAEPEVFFVSSGSALWVPNLKLI